MSRVPDLAGGRAVAQATDMGAAITRLGASKALILATGHAAGSDDLDWQVLARTAAPA
jgi:hypothetical protein